MRKNLPSTLLDRALVSGSTPSSRQWWFGVFVRGLFIAGLALSYYLKLRLDPSPASEWSHLQFLLGMVCLFGFALGSVLRFSRPS